MGADVAQQELQWELKLLKFDSADQSPQYPIW